MFDRHNFFDSLGLSIKPKFSFFIDNNQDCTFDFDTGCSDLNRNSKVFENYSMYCNQGRENSPTLSSPIQNKTLNSFNKSDRYFEVLLPQIVTNINAYKKSVYDFVKDAKKRNAPINMNNYLWLKTIKKRNVNLEDFTLFSCCLIYHSQIAGMITHNLIFLIAKARYPKEIIDNRVLLTGYKATINRECFLANLAAQIQNCYNSTYQRQLKNNNLGLSLKLMA